MKGSALCVGVSGGRLCECRWIRVSLIVRDKMSVGDWSNCYEENESSVFELEKRRVPVGTFTS